MTSKIIREDGTTEITSTEIKSCTYTEKVNSDTDLRPGCVASAYIEVDVFGSQSDAPTAGEELTYYQVDAEGNETLIGKFYAEPSIPNRNTYKFLAYDAVSKLDTDFSAQLSALQNSFPMTLSALVGYACTVAGVTLYGTFPMANTTIQAFYVDGITCRQVISWAAEIAGRFVRARSDGTIEFAWYSLSSAYRVAPGAGSANNETYIYYKQGGLNYENYTTSAIDRVVVHPTDEAGTEYIYPSETSSGNTLSISNNLLLTGSDATVYNAVAQNIYTVMSAVGTYRPARITLFPFNNPFRAGDIVKVTDIQGVSFVTPIMSMTVSASAAQLDSTGNEEYSVSSGAVQSELTTLADSIVRLRKLKVDWANIGTAIIGSLTATGIDASVISVTNLDADEIKTGSLTVLDANDNILLQADKDQNAVQIAGFEVSDNSFASDYVEIVDDRVVVYEGDKSSATRWAYMYGGASIWASNKTGPLHNRGYIGLLQNLGTGSEDDYLHINAMGDALGIQLGYYGGMIFPFLTFDISGGPNALSAQFGSGCNIYDRDSNLVSGTKLLWTNPSPSSAFAAQTLTISGMGDYNLITVICARTTTAGVWNSTVCYVPGTGETMYDLSQSAVGNSYEAVVRQRNVWFTRSANTVRFSAGWVTGGSGDDNTQMIPLYILGRKI